MMTIFLLFLAAGISAGAGRTLLDRLHIPTSRQALERFVYSAALGLGTAAYGVYALGVCGLLSFWPVTLWWLALAAIGGQGSVANARDLTRCFKHKTRKDDNDDTKPFVQDTKSAWIIRACGCILLVFGLIALAACFRPPGPQEWDVLSYHLADPKLFLQAHRVYTLPTEHHSNFPFTLEMLYAVGLLYNGYALANAFHLVMTLLTVAALIAFSRRLGCPAAGWLAGVAYLTTPVVLWEASTAYIDTGLGLYLTLATFAVITSLKTSQKTSQHTRVHAVSEDASDMADASGSNSAGRIGRIGNAPGQSWLILGGAMMGFGLGIKYLALIPFALLALLLLIQRTAWKRIAVYVGVALAIGSPWYIKNTLTMSNPVYPFAYSVFPHSAYWSADRAAGYQSEQNKFGTKPESIDVRSKLLNLARIPWDLLRQHPDQSGRPALLYCNPGEYNFTALYGGLYAALLLPLAFVRHVPHVVRFLVWLALAQIAAWFFLSQVGRYLIQIMPLLALAGAYTAVRWAYPNMIHSNSNDTPDQSAGEEVNHSEGVNHSGRGKEKGEPVSHSPRASFARLPGTLGIAAVFGQAAYVLLSVCTLPMNANALDTLGLMQLGQMPSGVSVPYLAANLGRAGSWEEDLRRHFDAYSAMQWINQNTPPNAGIALYEETRGFYLDRPYLWANQQHSSYIPYETLHTGVELSDWMLRHGIGYALINLNAATQNQPASRQNNNYPPELANGPNGHEEQALKLWYTSSGEGDQGHQLVGKAVQSGQWTPVFYNHGCIVLQINPMPTVSGAPTESGATP